MEFVHVVAGFEGSAADMRVLNWALEHGGLNIPDGKRFLVDLGYANTDKFVAPYRGFSYHLSEFRGQRRSYGNAKELYNHRHAQLRNVVERTFGVLKARWRNLDRRSFYPVEKQTKLVLAGCILHNYIRKFDPDDEEFYCLIETTADYPLEENASTSHVDGPAIRAGEFIRDSIARDLWTDYHANQANS